VDPAWIGAIAAVATLVLALAGLAIKRVSNGARWAWSLVHRAETFLEDFNGIDDRPGVPGRKGVLERLAVIEAELSYNSGSTVKDAVRRIDVNVKALAAAPPTEPQVQVNVH
jgi:hypothetical protein